MRSGINSLEDIDKLLSIFAFKPTLKPVYHVWLPIAFLMRFYASDPMGWFTLYFVFVRHEILSDIPQWFVPSDLA